MGPGPALILAAWVPGPHSRRVARHCSWHREVARSKNGKKNPSLTAGRRFELQRCLRTTSSGNETVPSHQSAVHYRFVDGASPLATPAGSLVLLAGTHLGHNIPDQAGDRFCIDVVCIAGVAAKPASHHSDAIESKYHEEERHLPSIPPSIHPRPRKNLACFFSRTGRSPPRVRII